MAQSSAFFGRKTLQFLTDLDEHNQRAWFEANKPRYEEHVVAPALALIESLAAPLAKISRHFVASPRRTGGSLLRIYRDIRFSKDQVPYKTNIGIQLRHERGQDIHAPGFYVHIEPGASFLGAGIWRPDPRALAAIRNEIVEQPKLWQRARDGRGFQRHFVLDGAQLRRLPRGIPARAAHQEDLRRKDFIGTCTLSDREVNGAQFASTVAERFARAAPLVAFLCGALDLEF